MEGIAPPSGAAALYTGLFCFGRGAFPTEEWTVFWNNANQPQTEIKLGGSNTLVPGSGGMYAAAANTLFKYASVAFPNDSVQAYQGDLGAPADTSGAFPNNLDALSLGTSNARGGSGGASAMHIRRVLYWNQRLPNATLQAITT